MLVNCAAYQNGKKLADIGEDEVHNYVCRSDCFVWVALRDSDAAKLDQMQKQFDLHPLAVEDARNGHQRPKIEEYGDSVFAVLHMIEMDGAELRKGEVDVFAGKNYVLSVRSGAQKGFGDVRARCEREPKALKHGSGYVLYALMDAVVDRYFPVIEALETELETIEERIFDETSSPRANIRALYRLKQKVSVLKHAVAPLLEGLEKLHGGRVPPIVAGMGDYFRDVSDHLERLNQAIDTIRDTIVTAISVNLSMIALQESETMKRLAAYAALVAVPTLIAGIYGMNFEHMPELDWLFGYPLTLALMGGIDGYLFYKLRKARWL
jgi:magnesium transporter